MIPTDIEKVTAWEEADLTLMARWQGSTGGYPVASNVSNLRYGVYDLDAPSTARLVANSTAVTPSSVVLSTLHTDGRWTKDTTGYNFRHTLSSTVFGTGRHNYAVEYQMTSTGGEVSRLRFDIFAKDSLLT